MRYVGIILALCARSPLFAQATGGVASTPRPAVSVPFIGCASSGQIERLEAPKGSSRFVPISPKHAQALAYYRSADGIGLLAPRGWYCEGASGSRGYGLSLAPNPINSSLPGWEGFEGPAIEVSHITSQNSGRYEIAEIMARVFPEYRTLAIGVLKSMDLPASYGPYPKDTLRYRSKTVVEYSTPAQTEGLATHSWLKKSGLPIAGVAILIGDPPDLLLVSVRLPPHLAQLTPVIVRQIERDTINPPRI